MDKLNYLFDEISRIVRAHPRIYRAYSWSRDYIIGHYLSKIGALRLKREVLRCHAIEDYVDLAFTFRVPPLLAINPTQIKEEIIELLKLIAKTQPRLLCEIGTGFAGTTFLLTRVADPKAAIISIDLPWPSGGYPSWKIPFYRSFGSADQKIYLLQMNSHDSVCLQEVCRIIGDSKLDFLFIDGDHTYEGVKKDFEMYGRLVRRGGIVAFHDIVPRPPESGCEVNEYWLDIRDNYQYREIVKDWNQEWAGIGLIFG